MDKRKGCRNNGTTTFHQFLRDQINSCTVKLFFKNIICLPLVFVFLFSCKKDKTPDSPPSPKQVSVKNIFINSVTFDNNIHGINTLPLIRIEFTEPVNPTTIATAVKLTTISGTESAITTTLQNKDSVLLVQPSTPLTYISKYNFRITADLRSSSGGSFLSSVDNNFITKIDSSRKFPAISDNALLDLVQQQTFKYFWDYGHPVSGLARERSNATPETVTSGGSGFGVMAIVTAINRGFITRAQGLTRLQTIVSFLKNTAPKFHGAFSHWMNGSTGAIVPFGQNDDGADLVETSYMIMGLLTARQFFN